MFNAWARGKQPIAERSLAMLQVLANIACKGHAVGSASGSTSDALTLATQEGCAKVCEDGVLEMDSR